MSDFTSEPGDLEGEGSDLPWWRSDPPAEPPAPNHGSAAGAPAGGSGAPGTAAHQPGQGPEPTRPYPGQTPYGGAPSYGTGGSGWAGGGGWGGGQGQGWGAPGGGWGQPGGWEPRASGSGKGRRQIVMAAGAVLTAAAVLAGVGIGYAVWRPPSAPRPASSISPFSPRTATATRTPSTKTSNAAGGPSNISAIAAKVDPTLVDINTVLGDSTAEAAGTGMVLTSTGKVLTNNHVIEGSTSIRATDLGNGATYQATVLGFDRTQDVAVIQLKGASGLKTANFGSSSSVTVGQAVVGIGNAGGTGGTPSTAGGSVTALDQAITASDSGTGTVEHLTGLIESNCDIQAGDSGGPLVDTSSQIIGMDTAASASQGFRFSGAATGQGYSIPINAALSIAKQIEAGKSSAGVHIGPTPFLGVEVQAATSPTAGSTPFGHLGFGSRTPTATPRNFGSATTTTATAPSTTKGVTGVYVAGVLPNTPAEHVGLSRGDYITAVAGASVGSPDALTKVIEKYKPGTTVKVSWIDTSGQSQSATVTFAAGPNG